jgi:hypothetical protein
MLEYRVITIDRAGNITGAQHFRAKDDEAAVRVADNLNVGSIGDGYELW